MVEEKDIAEKCQLHNNSDIQLFQRFQGLQNLLTVTTEKSKQFYFRIYEIHFHLIALPCIPPIYHDNNCIADFKEKAETFNNFLAKQCTIVNNTSNVTTSSLKRTNNGLSMTSFNKDDIAKMIKKP